MALGKTAKIVVALFSPVVLFLAAAVVGILIDPLTGGRLTDGSTDGNPDTLGWTGLILGLIVVISILLFVVGFRSKSNRGLRVLFFGLSVGVLIIGTVLDLRYIPIREPNKAVNVKPTTAEKSQTSIPADISLPNEEWVDTSQTELDVDSVKFWDDDKYMISARVLNTSGIRTHYRLKLDIKVIGGVSRRAPFCTTTPAESKPGFQIVNMKVLTRDPEGQSWSGLLDITSDITFSFTWSLHSAEKSTKWCGAH